MTAACKRLARYIHARGLTAGDTLPPQEELCRELGFCHNTLSPAMRLLVDMGLITRRTNHGTEIRSLEPLACLPWTVGVVGLASEGPDSNVFYADLLHRILSTLARTQCLCRTYFRLPRDLSHWPENCLADYPHLDQDIREERIDGIVALTNLSIEEQTVLLDRHNLPVCHVGSWESMPSAVLLDASEMVRHAYGLIRKTGCRRLLLVDTLGSLTDSCPTAVLRQTAAVDGGPVCETITITATHDIGREIAAHLLSRPPDRRPAGVIVTDDYVAMGMVAAFAEAGGYHPLTAVLTSPQIPLHFALPVYRYELDVDVLVAEACAMLLRRLLNPGAPQEVRHCGARPVLRPEGLSAPGGRRLLRSQAMEFLTV